MSNNILAIDPGTNCGWCLRNGRGDVLAHGTWNLRGGRFEGGGMRFLRMRKMLEDVAESVTVGQVVYEEVRRHMGVDAAHIYGGIVAIIQEFCESRKPKIPYTAIPVGTVKKLATGKGNAQKDAMIQAARTKWPELVIGNDNEADALWISQAALTLRDA